MGGDIVREGAFFQFRAIVYVGTGITKIICRLKLFLMIRGEVIGPNWTAMERREEGILLINQ